MNIRFCVDLDGTLSKESIGNIIDEQNIDPNDFKTQRNVIASFHKNKGVEFLNKLKLAPYIITGRKESLRETTEIWLYSEDIPHTELIMLPDDYYPDGIFNQKLYTKFKIEEHKKLPIEFAMDDSAYIVKALNNIGIPTYLVKDDFGKVLLEALEEHQ